MKISIIIPSYKPQAWIWECLDSIKNQTFPKENFELILVLNGCNEPYYSQIKEYIDQNFIGYNVNLIQTDIGGVSNARNIGLDNITGEYITFIDDDDYVSSVFLEELFQCASPDVISLCRPIAFTEGVNSEQPYPITSVFDKLCVNECVPYTKARKYFSGPCMKLIHKDIVRNLRFDTSFSNGEDSLFMFLISDRFKTVSFTSEKAVYYRRYRKSSAVTTQRPFVYWLRNGVRMLKCYAHIYLSNPKRYNLSFFFTRCLGVLHQIIVKYKMS